MPATASLVQLHVIASGGFRTAYQRVLPEFERTTGIRVTTGAGASQGKSPDVIGAQLRRGVTADMVIMSREGLDELIEEGRLIADSVVDLACTPTGVAVRAGAPVPDISSVEAFKQTLLNAKSIAYPASTTGFYLADRLFPKLGIAEALAGKCSTRHVSAVANDEVEIAIRPASELLNVAGLHYAGPIPAEVQFISVFSAAIVTGSQEIAAARQLIAFLASEKTVPAIRHAGMEPAHKPSTP
jgi:molybdate transport system substrate-binding protein